MGATYSRGREKPLQKSPVSFKLNEVERQLLDSIAVAIGGARPDALRYALGAARKELGLYAQTAEAYIAGLRATIDEDATLMIELDDSWSPVVSVDGVRRVDIYVPCLAVNLGADGDCTSVTRQVTCGSSSDSCQRVQACNS